MARRLTQEEFVERATKVHNGKYDYSKVVYVNNSTKVCIICPEHGEFWQSPYHHLLGKGCFECSCAGRGQKRTHTNEWFIEKAKSIHGNKYDYSKTKYKGLSFKVCIICPEHGEFWQKAGSHLQGCGCSRCSNRYMDESLFKEKASIIHGGKYDYSKVNYTNIATKVCIICPTHGEFWMRPNDHLRGKGCAKCVWERQKNDTENFIERSRKVHDGKYDYSLVNYERVDKKVKIICPIHGVFEQIANSHLGGQGCPKCSQDAKRRTTEQFIAEAKAVHGEKYDYSLVDYHQSFEKVKIICMTHGVFEQAPHHHLEGRGCPLCSSSQGELAIIRVLDKFYVEYESQYKILLNLTLFGRNEELRVDFFLPKENLIIEYNGIQHYEEVKYFHKKDNGFEKQKKRDRKLKKWCKDNGVKLLTIKYTEKDKIEEILKQHINFDKYEKN